MPVWPHLSFVCLFCYLVQDTSATLFLWLQMQLQNCMWVLGGRTTQDPSDLPQRASRSAQGWQQKRPAVGLRSRAKPRGQRL